MMAKVAECVEMCVPFYSYSMTTKMCYKSILLFSDTNDRKAFMKWEDSGGNTGSYDGDWADFLSWEGMTIEEALTEFNSGTGGCPAEIPSTEEDFNKAKARDSL